MGFFDGVKRQLRSVIEWKEASPETLFWKWSGNGDEIKNASKLIVAPGQGAIFLHEGKIQSVHLKEGVFEMETANIPFWTTITKIMQSFESEHKVEILFFWQTEFLDRKWGTKSPVKYLDPVYKFPVGLRAFGNFSFRITQPENFFVNVVGGRDEFLVVDAQRAISDRFLQPLTDLLAESRLAYTEIDANRNELAAQMKTDFASEFEKLGFALTDFRLENTDFDEDTQKRIGRIADITAESGAAAAAGMTYAEMQKLEALRDAAKNEGGIAGMGVGMGAGLGLGQIMGTQMGQSATPSPAPAGKTAEERLQKLAHLYEKKLLTEAEFTAKKADILADL